VTILRSAADPWPAGLHWPVRRSFLDYLARVAGGRAVLSEGASVDPARGITFPPLHGDVDPGSGDGTVRFGGAVRFVGHLGLLDVRLRAPSIAVAGGRGTLSMAARQGPVAIAGFVADYTVSAGSGVWRAHDVRLLRAGAAVFDDVYAEGDPLDPFVAVRTADTAGQRST
jgi:hypothetical protein